MIQRELQSSPPKLFSYNDGLKFQLSDSSSEEDVYQLHSEGSVVKNIINRRRQARASTMRQLNSSPSNTRTIYRYTERTRRKIRDNKLSNNRGDIEAFVINKERQRELSRLELEASKYALREDEIDLLLKDFKPTPLSNQHEKLYDISTDEEQAELLRLQKQQEEYEYWEKQEQLEIERMLESFNIH